MAEELQSLLQKINDEGVKKAEAERERILAEANTEATRVIESAKAEAEKRLAAAKSECEALQKRAESAVAQAARDILLKLKAELEARLNAAVADATAQALTPELMAGIVRELTAKFVADPDAELTLRCAVKDRDALDAALKSALAESLRKAPTVLADHSVAGGVEVGIDGGKLYFDFSLDAIREVVGTYTGQHIAELFSGK